MAEGRMLNRTVASSRQLAQVPTEAALFFLLMLPHADAHGRLDGDVEDLKAICAPTFGQYDDVTIVACLRALVGAVDRYGRGLIEWYEVEGRRYVQFTGWDRHQEIRRRGKARRPNPNDKTAQRVTDLLPESPGVPGPSGNSRSLPEFREGPAKEGKKERSDTSFLPSSSMESSGVRAPAATPGGAAGAAGSIERIVDAVVQRLGPGRSVA